MASGSSAPSGRHMPSAIIMVRYDTLSDEWESPHDRSRLSQDCTEPGGGGRVPSRRIAGFSCRRQEICFAGLASRGVRKSDAYAGAAGSVCGGGTRDFPADSWRLGKMGHTHIRLAAASEDVLTGALRTAWKLRIDKNAKTSRKKTMWRSAAE